MRPEIFQTLAKERLEELTNILVVKGAEYATNGDRLHNFNASARIDNVSKARALHGFMIKHYTNYRDMLDKFDRDEPVPVKMIRERFGDLLAYFMIQEIIFLEKYDAANISIDNAQTGGSAVYNLGAIGLEKAKTAYNPNADIIEAIKHNSPGQCVLTDSELIEASKEWLHKLCNTGGHAWTMSIPARPNKDTDLLFAELISRFEENKRYNTTTVDPALAASHISGATESDKLQLVLEYVQKEMAPVVASISRQRLERIESFIKSLMS